MADGIGCPSPKTRVDYYGGNLFDIKQSNGKPKYPLLTNVLINAPGLAHGIADMKRALSVNTYVVTPDRTSLGETTINGLRTVKDTIKLSDPGLCRPKKLTLGK